MTVPGVAGRPEDPSVLWVDHVSKRYAAPDGGRQFVDAVDDVSLTVGPAQAVGLIGPNGAGKSTLLKLIAGVTAPTSGHIRRTSRVTTVIELGAGLHPDLTGREGIDLLARLAHGRELTSGPVFDEVVEFSGLGAVLDRRMRTYSTGMIARIAFSVAVHLPTDLLLVDEVLSVGDADFQQRSRDRIFALRDHGTAVVVVSHDLDLVAMTCDRALLLDHGRVETDGPSDATIRRYRGEAEPVAGDRSIGLVLTGPSTLPSGSTVVAEFTSGGRATADVQFVIPSHSGLESTHGPTIVCGEATTAFDRGGRHRVSIPTEGLPPGRYELRVGLCEVGESAGSVTQSVPFTLTGPAGPNAVRLRSDIVVRPLRSTGPLAAS